MKIVVERKEWHRLIGGGCKEEVVVHEFEDIQIEKTSWYDFGEVYQPRGMQIKGALPREVNFSFKVKEINANNVVLEAGGISVLTLQELGGTKTKTKVLFLGEEQRFQTPTMDFGICYTITLENNEQEKTERLKAGEISSLLLRCSLSKDERTIYSSIICELKDKYYNAIIKCLNKGIVTHISERLSFSDMSTETILSTYWLSDCKNGDEYFARYIKSVLILNSLEKAGEDDCMLYCPYSIE